MSDPCSRRRFMRRGLVIVAAAAAYAPMMPVIAGAATPAPVVGQPAPEFSGIDTAGKTIRLADLKGKTVVLEWSNHDCPYVKKHYSSGNMQAVQKDAEKDGVVWLTIVSSPSGEQGNVSAQQADTLTRSRGAAPSAVILDPEGKIARAYEARVTPHMFVIDKTGTLQYMGGIDDKPSTNTADIAGAKPFVRLALAALAKGEKVADAVTKPYGCSVKYK